MMAELHGAQQQCKTTGVGIYIRYMDKKKRNRPGQTTMGGSYV